ncbi:MAG TPA: GNAT family N-acetyltransferase [Streptosporangiaceae bacterium]|nr:GNAT family N-acetyltransferase [Streptosporangiaceae bacterium]
MRQPSAWAVPSWAVTFGEQAPDVVERLLGELPGWFGVEESNRGYVESARHMPTYLVRPDGSADAAPAGVLLAARHFPAAAEIYLLAVSPGVHRQGAGRALVEAFEADLIADGVSLLQVKTNGPSHPDAGYVKTRLFYEAMGFLPLEEIPDFWPTNPCLIMIKALSGRK